VWNGVKDEKRKRYRPEHFRFAQKAEDFENLKFILGLPRLCKGEFVSEGEGSMLHFTFVTLIYNYCMCSHMTYASLSYVLLPWVCEC
jgi:hypothetical protein